MERVNGFLDLDDYFKEIQEQENIGLIDLIIKGFIKESEYKEYHYWLKINDEDYYFKPSVNSYKELIAAECAKFLEIDYVDYDLAIYHNLKGVISKSYRKKHCKYISLLEILHAYLINTGNEFYLSEMGYTNNKVPTNLDEEFKKSKELNNLEIIWQALEQRYPGRNAEIDNIIHKLVLLFIFNILVMQNDAEPQNFEIEESEQGIDLMPFIDGELCFPSFKFFLEPSSSLGINFNDFDANNYEHLKEFLQISCSEYIDLFLGKFDKFTIENFEKILDDIENKIGVKIPDKIRNGIINNFKLNRQRIEEILEEMQIRKNGVKLNG